MSTTALNKAYATCGVMLPLDSFVRRNGSRDGHRSTCKPCAARYAREWRARRRSKRLDRFAGELARENNLNRAAALCGRMLSDFGGPDRFASLWKSQVDHAVSLHPGSPSVLRSLAAVVNLVEIASARQKPDLSTWTDADLAAEFERLLSIGAQNRQPPGWERNQRPRKAISGQMRRQSTQRLVGTFAFGCVSFAPHFHEFSGL